MKIENKSESKTSKYVITEKDKNYKGIKKLEKEELNEQRRQTNVTKFVIFLCLLIKVFGGKKCILNNFI